MAERQPVTVGGIAASPVRMAALLVAGVFLVVGVLGFIPGATTDYDMLEWAGHDSTAKLLGIFEVSILHNAVHLLFGLVGLAMSRTSAQAKAFLIGGGIVYLALWIYGLVIDKASAANFVPLNTADDWLHFGLGIGMLALGAFLGRSLARPAMGETSERGNQAGG